MIINGNVELHLLSKNLLKFFKKLKSFNAVSSIKVYQSAKKVFIAAQNIDWFCVEVKNLVFSKLILTTPQVGHPVLDLQVIPFKQYSKRSKVEVFGSSATGI